MNPPLRGRSTSAVQRTTEWKSFWYGTDRVESSYPGHPRSGWKVVTQATHDPTFGYHDPMERCIRKEERQSAWASLSTGPGFLPPHIPWDPTLYASSAPRSLVYALNFRKKILYGILKKTTHCHTNRLRFCTFFLDLVPYGSWPPPNRF